MEYLAPLGIVLILLPCPMSARDLAVPLAGTVVTYNAENLALIAMIQTLSPAPLGLSQCRQLFNMRSARSSLGGPEKILSGLAGPTWAASMICRAERPAVPRFAPLRRAKWRRIHGPTPAGRLGPGQHGHRRRLAGRRQRHLREQILFDCDLIALAAISPKDSPSTKTDWALRRWNAWAGRQFLTDELTMTLLRGASISTKAASIGRHV